MSEKNKKTKDKFLEDSEKYLAELLKKKKDAEKKQQE